MCVYCNMGDSWFRHDPPWKINPVQQPLVPQPYQPYMPHIPWGIDKLKEYLEVLEKVKKLEEQIGCPCEPNKADYIKLLEDRIKELEKPVKKKPVNKRRQRRGVGNRGKNV